MQEKTKKQIEDLCGILPDLLDGIQNTYCELDPENKICTWEQASAYLKRHPQFDRKDVLETCPYWDDELGCIGKAVKDLLDEIELP